MCGICGEIRFDGSAPDASAVDTMTCSMTRRGPDGSGLFVKGSVALGHRRLKIIDLSERGAQPMVDSELGLAMVFGFVKQSGGHVKIYSEPGEGTTVKLYLPRAIGGATAGPRTSTPVELPRGSATILVVEDEAAVREVACTILRELGYRVLEAGDGEEGLRVFGANAAGIDLLLTDVILPGRIRGRELSERILAVRPEVRVVFMSGYTENSIVHHGRLDDGVTLVGKPFRREQLAVAVAEALRTADAGLPENVVPLKPRQEG